ncbi:MAG: molybdopterin molybdotransferase MoeA [Elusimicrobiota bacterium]|nr:molybdopterin molybdotransferase MoeA [Elusimicrobiota bacterium]
MLKFNEAKKILLKNIDRLPTVKSRMNEDILNTVLAENIISQENIPNYDNSSMDGYAVKSADTKKPALLKVIGEVKAGQHFSKKIKNGESVKIMTGAPIPKGTDAVVMVENTKEQGRVPMDGRQIKILKPVKKGENIRKAGEDIKRGEMILKNGTVLNPAQIGLLASIGKTEINTIKRPKIAIITTGDEIVSASVKKLPKGKVRNSNLWTLTTLIKRDGAIPVHTEKIPDNLAKIKSAIRYAISASDAVIISAGISAGEYDFVKLALKQLGAKMLIFQIAIKPGKPFAFSKIRSVPIFSLPGNPVSTMVTYEELVRPAILKMMGKQSVNLPTIKAIIKHDIHKKHGRREFLRGMSSKKKGEDGKEKYFVSSAGSQGSGILSSMSKANCFIVLDEKTCFIKKGGEVDIRILPN